jgi:hypothetical protein
MTPPHEPEGASSSDNDPTLSGALGAHSGAAMPAAIGPYAIIGRLG